MTFTFESCILHLPTIVLLVLELFRQCGIFLLGFKTVPTVWYFSIGFVTVPTVWYIFLLFIFHHVYLCINRRSHTVRNNLIAHDVSSVVT